MLKKIKLAPLTDLLPALSKIAGLPAEDSQTEDLQRIAAALERIADALEVRNRLEQEYQENYWVTIPDAHLQKVQVTVPQETTPAEVPEVAPISPPSTNGHAPAAEVPKAEPPKAEPEVVPPVKSEAEPLSTNGHAPAAPTKVVPLPPKAEPEVVPPVKSEAEPKVATPPVPSPANPLEAFFVDKGFHCEFEPEAKNQAALDKVAVHLAEKFNYCQDLHNFLKDNLKSSSLHLDIIYPIQKVLDGSHIVYCLRYLELAKAAGLLIDYSYDNKTSPKTLRVLLSGSDKQFMHGKWLEDYTRVRLNALAAKNGWAKNNNYLAKPRVKIKNGANQIAAELDLFFSYNTRFFCIEAKYNVTEADLRDKLLNKTPIPFSKNNILVVLAENSVDDCQKLTQKLGIKVVNFVQFEIAVAAMVTKQAEG